MKHKSADINNQNLKLHMTVSVETIERIFTMQSKKSKEKKCI
jgi:hypothetical protein